jgi:hypothetical protein
VVNYRIRCIVCGRFVVAGQTDRSGRPLHLGCQPVTPDVAGSIFSNTWPALAFLHMTPDVAGSISNTWPALAFLHMNEPEWFDPFGLVHGRDCDCCAPDEVE